MALNCCWISGITSTEPLRSSLFPFQRLSSFRSSLFSRNPTHSSSNAIAIPFFQTDVVYTKNFLGKPTEEKQFPCGYPDGGKKEMSRSQSFQSFAMPRKDKKGFTLELKDQQAEAGNFQDAGFLNAVVKVYCTHTAPDYSLPWQKQRQYTSTGSAFMIGDGKLLTNAHCVEHDTQVKVKRRGDDTKYVAKVLARGIDCDVALLSVENEEFWKGAEPLSIGRLPHLQDAVTVVGYPLGGDTISVTKGVVSRIEVTSYAHGSSDLLGIQIDAAINPGNSGGPAFNDQGECIGIAFQVLRSDDTENIGYVIPTTVVSHFLTDYERNGKYTGFPCLGVLMQKLENPALRSCLRVPSNEGVLVRRVEPTSDAHSVLKEGDVIVSFDGVQVGCEGTVPFRSTERIAFRYLISQKFSGDIVELGVIRNGSLMKVQTALNPRVHLVPYHIEGGQPSYLIVAGLVFTPLSEPLIEEECEETMGLKLLTKARYSLARFKGEQLVILSQVLANEVNIGYEDMGNQQVLKLNGKYIRNIHHLAHLVDSCKDKYLVFEFEDNYLVVLERESATAASSCILKDYGIPTERSSDLTEPYLDNIGDNNSADHDFGDSPVSNLEIGFDGLLWA
ncbi:protease Do-like 2, chloroplastic [Silene latifolia]|uniref:protease Do-like 2, chloroplastic n=1 Tax=Silene latifolia TaxID=37657 RepID=UPI003D77E090